MAAGTKIPASTKFAAGTKISVSTKFAAGTKIPASTKFAAGTKIPASTKFPAGTNFAAGTKIPASTKFAARTKFAAGTKNPASTKFAAGTKIYGSLVTLQYQTKCTNPFTLSSQAKKIASIFLLQPLPGHIVLIPTTDKCLYTLLSEIAPNNVTISSTKMH